jgi:Base plate wedge protein 53
MLRKVTSMASNFFSIVPNIRVGVPGSKDTFDQEYIEIKNIFRRVKADFDKVKSLLAFEKYSIPGDELPYHVAQRIYRSTDYEWVILLTNNITNVYTQWPLSQREFEFMLRKKYGTQSDAIHHWETKEIVFNGNILVQSGIIVDRDYKFKRPDGIIISNDGLVRPISNYEYEYQKNEKKRDIYLLNPIYLDQFVGQMETLLSYYQSDDILTDKLKSTGDEEELLFVKTFDIGQ